MNYPFMPQRTNHQEIRRDLAERAAPRFAAFLQRTEYFAVEPDGVSSTARFFTPEGQDPLITFRHNADETVAISVIGQTDNHPLKIDDTSLHFAQHTASLLTEIIAERYPYEQLIVAIASRHGATTHAAIANSAERLVREQLKLDSESRQRSNSLDHAIQRMNFHIERESLDRRVIDLHHRVADLEEFSPNSHTKNRHFSIDELDTWNYNLFLRNRDPFLRLINSGHLHPLRLYVTSIADPALDPPTFRHPGQVITQVKDFLQLTPAQWKLFLRLSSEEYIHHSRPAEYLRDRLAPLAAAHANLVTDADLSTLFRAYDTHFLHHNPAWTHGDPEVAWSRIIGAYVRHILLTPPPQAVPFHSQAIAYVADAFRSRTHENQSWGPGDWDTLTERATRWHQRLRRRSYDVSPSDLKKSWQFLTTPDLLEQIVSDVQAPLPLHIEPLDTGVKLQNAARAMDNCLNTYIHSCATGQSRIFLIKRGKQILSAIQLILRSGEWSIGQSEAPHRLTVPEFAHNAASHLVSHYQRLHLEAA